MMVLSTLKEFEFMKNGLIIMAVVLSSVQPMYAACPVMEAAKHPVKTAEVVVDKTVAVAKSLVFHPVKSAESLVNTTLNVGKSLLKAPISLLKSVGNDLKSGVQDLTGLEVTGSDLIITG